MTNNDEVWLSPDGHKKLNEELKELIENRPKIAAEINERREEGDLKENGGYHAARELQGQQEARIRQLQSILSNAKIGTAPVETGKVAVGTVVTIYYDDDKDDQEKFLLANREQASTGQKLEIYSPASPLGAAIIDAIVGETRTYTTPNGDKTKVTILKIEPFVG